MTIYIIAKGIISKTKIKVIKTSLLQYLTLHPSPTHIIQGRYFVFAPLGRLSRASLIIVLVFINKNLLIKKYNIIIKRLLVLKSLCLTNRLLSSFITHYFIIKMTIGHYTEFILFYIIKLLLLILVILKIP